MKITLYTKHILLSIIALTMVNIAKAGFLLTQQNKNSLYYGVKNSLSAYSEDKDAYLIINKEPGKETYSLAAIDTNDQKSNMYSMSTKKTLIAENLSNKQVLSKIQEIAIPRSPLLYDGSFIEVIQRNTTYEIVLVEAQDNGSSYPQKGSVRHKFLCEGLGWHCPSEEKENETNDTNGDVSNNMIPVLGEDTIVVFGKCSYMTAKQNANQACMHDYNGKPGKILKQDAIKSWPSITCQVEVECFLPN